MSNNSRTRSIRASTLLASRWAPALASAMVVAGWGVVAEATEAGIAAEAPAETPAIWRDIEVEAEAAASQNPGPQSPGLQAAGPQATGAPPSAAAGRRPPPPILPIPWLNDRSYLADPARRTGSAWEKLAYIPLGDRPDVYLSIGGEARLNYTHFEDQALGIRGGKNTPLQQRLRLHGDLHLGRNLRVFAELGDNREHFEDSPTPANRDRLDLHQAFVDISFDVGDGNRLTLRPGRFQLPLGDTILVSLSDGVNLRLTYEGVRAMLQLKDGTRIDAFYTRPIRVSDRDPFDNAPNRDAEFSGLYLTRPISPIQGARLDLYTYKVTRPVARYQAGVGHEDRYSLGARVHGRRASWDYDTQLIHQFGDFGDRDISAWGLMGAVGHTFSQARFTPRVGLKVNSFSGDDDPTDGKIGTFVPPAMRFQYYTTGGWFTAMNQNSVHLDTTWRFTPRASLNLEAIKLQRASSRDAIYLGPIQAPLAIVPTSDRDVGSLYNITGEYQANRHLNFRVFYTRYDAGKAMLRSGGKDSNYFGVWAQAFF